MASGTGEKTGRGSGGELRRRYSVTQPSAQQKGPYPTRRYNGLTKTLKALIRTTSISITLSLLWQSLELLIYGQIQPRLVDGIMLFMFMPFIYTSVREKHTR